METKCISFHYNYKFSHNFNKTGEKWLGKLSSKCFTLCFGSRKNKFWTNYPNKLKPISFRTVTCQVALETTNIPWLPQLLQFMDLIKMKKLAMVCVIVHYISITLGLVIIRSGYFTQPLKSSLFGGNFFKHISFIIIKKIACKNIVSGLL